MLTHKKTLVAAVFAVGLCAGVIIGDLATGPETGRAASPDRQQLKEDIQSSNEFASQLEKSFRSVAEYVRPAVVFIETKKEIEAPQMPMHPFFRRFFDNEEEFRRFFEQQPQQRRQRRGMGSGFIIDKDGYVLTNAHVVKGADEVDVKMTDGSTHEAKVSGLDEQTDLAVLKLQGEFGELPTLELGASDNVDPGEWVIAVGHPFGLQYTVSAGIVSATGRRIGIAEYENLIQTDAAITPGNSGGPLVNLEGDVIGINTAIFSAGQPGNMGIGFAIPSDMARTVIDALKEGREVSRGYLGIYGDNLTPELAQQLNYDSTQGALVNEVMEDGPATAAQPVDPSDAPEGLQAGDIITEWDGKKVKDFTELRLMVARTEPGKEVELKLWREGDVYTYSLTCGERSEAQLAQQQQEAQPENWLGLQVQELTREMARRMGKPDLQGVVVSDVSPESPAREAVDPGDVILSVNRQRINSVEQYQRIVSQTTAESGVLMRFIEADTGRARFVAIRG